MTPMRTVAFSKVAGFHLATLLKVTLLDGCFSRFLNCTDGTKSPNALHIFTLIHIASSTCISKVIIRENDCLLLTIFVFFCAIFTFGIDGSRTQAAFKMGLFPTKVNGWKLLLLFQRVPSYIWQRSYIRL